MDFVENSSRKAIKNTDNTLISWHLRKEIKISLALQAKSVFSALAVFDEAWYSMAKKKDFSNTFLNPRFTDVIVHSMSVRLCQCLSIRRNVIRYF